jgi:hypothetical protein
VLHELLLIELTGLGLVDQRSISEYGDFVAKVEDLVEVMRDVQDRLALVG